MSRRMICMLLAAAALWALLPVVATSAQAAESSYPPYAQVVSEYTPEVSTGTIRYICQQPEGAEFRYDYWKKWAKKSGSYKGPEMECGTACISMALSYVGVNKTPKDILDYGNGYTHFMDWGDAGIHNLSVSDFQSAMDNYINGEGRYSPPVIHLPGYSKNGHFVVVIGRIDDQTYEILDPNNRAVTRMTITGNKAKYTLYGNSKSGKIDRLHQWYNPNAAPAIVRKTYPASCVLKIKESVSGMSNPCSAEMNPKSTVRQTFDTDQTVNAVQLILNDWDEYWYKIETSDQSSCYIPASKAEYQTESAQIAITNVNNPTVLAKGNGFSIKGKITAGNSCLTAVSASVRKGRGSEGEVVLTGNAAVSSSTYNLSGSSVNGAVRFGKLEEGEYTYIVEAQYINYYMADGNGLSGNSGTVVLHEAVFTVEDMTDRNTPAKPVLQVSNEPGQVTFSWESTAHTTHYQLCIRKKNAEGNWEELERIDEAASGTVRTLPFGEYLIQLTACNRNAEASQNAAAADDVPITVVCEHVYGEGVYTKEPTCQETGIMTYTCTACGEVKEETVEKVAFHTPGPAATATTDQVCTVCGVVLQEALGEPEPTETQAEVSEAEPVNHGLKWIGIVIGVHLVLSVLGGGVAGGIVFFKKRSAIKEIQKPQETAETELAEETPVTENTEQEQEIREVEEMQEAQS